MKKQESRFQTITGPCDFCEGHMDNCPYCRGMGIIHSEMDMDTGMETFSKPFRVGSGHPATEECKPYRAPDWWCPECKASRPFRTTNSTAHGDYAGKPHKVFGPVKDSPVIQPGETYWQCCIH